MPGSIEGGLRIAVDWSRLIRSEKCGSVPAHIHATQQSARGRPDERLKRQLQHPQSNEIGRRQHVPRSSHRTRLGKHASGWGRWQASISRRADARHAIQRAVVDSRASPGVALATVASPAAMHGEAWYWCRRCGHSRSRRRARRRADCCRRPIVRARPHRCHRPARLESASVEGLWSMFDSAQSCLWQCLPQ